MKELSSLNIKTSGALIDDQINIMKKCGINVNFSPVVDLSDDSTSHIFRTDRIISTQPDSIISFAKFYMDKHKKKRILSTIKHFPGYGDTYDNSDRYLTKYKGSIAQFIDGFSIFTVLLPKTDFIMVSNLIYPFLDSVPAIMSKKIVDYIQLYNKDAVTLTDDIACMSYENVFGTFKNSLLAGCDMFILMNDTLYEPLVDSLTVWVGSGEYSETQLNKILTKIILKKEYLFKIISKNN